MKYIVYHGTDKVFRRFSLKHSTMGVFWFTSDKASIESGDSGAAGRSRILKLEVTIEKPAGWKEYDQLMLAQLKSQGYDGAILPKGEGQYDGFVFHPSQVKILGVEGEPRSEATLMAVFRTPESIADAKSALVKLDRNLRKWQAERDDAERSQYPMGVQVADGWIAEYTAARAHFAAWLEAHGVKAPAPRKARR